ncbi:MAG: lactate/malate family dehydrogenase [Solirubrobacteraceae bacterium]
MTRVVVAGAGGGVGASLVFNLLLSPLECEVVMVDARENMVRSHLWDLEQVLEQIPLTPTGGVRAGGPDDIDAADVLVVTAAAPLTVNTSRMVYLQDNAAIVAPLLDRVTDGWPGTVILVTNPVDPLSTWAQRRTGLPRERLLGYTLNDSLRLRTGIGRVLDVGPGRVDAWTVGDGLHRRLVRAPRRTGLRALVDLDLGLGSAGWSARAWMAATSCGPPRSCSRASTAWTASASASRSGSVAEGRGASRSGSSRPQNGRRCTKARGSSATRPRGSSVLSPKFGGSLAASGRA